MALYQVSVLKKYLKSQEEKGISKAYKKYASYFLNPVIQENIRSSKEEQFQATFLNELFVNILGYTLNPHPNYNLTTEHKNEKNARKADGAILHNGTALAVIELKGTNTKDLESIRKQAFDYKANQKGCVYVITSNFEKLRFYINDATEFLEFNLFELTLEGFSLLYLCLYKENLVANIPLKIKEASIVVEKAITKSFYKDYSLFKRELFRDLVRQNTARIKNNRQVELDAAAPSSRGSLSTEEEADLNRLEKNIKLTLFKKSQKLIDRFLFIFFAEDRGLLPPNSTMKIVDDWHLLENMDAVMPLYDRFKLYFNYLDKGRKGTGQRAEIYAYNGGLFKPDAILDQLEIDDKLLAKHSVQLAKYDFESQVDVNILGHIFENSLNEIESVNAEIEGADFDKQKSKRKKDGVFYTPKYITKYIVENTVGKLCEEKKTELGFREEEYFKGRKNRNKTTIENLVSILDAYRDWLLQLSICDPACGSGAFLNQALDFLIKEHRYIDELKAKLLGGGLVFSDIENTILENNIYGVDINEESVEIAKLSLWLRTAQPRRKLNDLSSTIKCGNSLIDDKKVAGDKAFKWEEEFPEIFKNGGFDVVIGNPPYVQSHSMTQSTKDYIYKRYKTSEYQINLYTVFTEKFINILKQRGLYGIIIPNYWMSTKYDEKFRKLLFLENHCIQILNTFEVFENVIVDTVIIIGEKQNEEKFPKITNILSIADNLKTHHDRWIAIDNQAFIINKDQQFLNLNDSTLLSFQNTIDFPFKIKLKELVVFKKGMQPYEKGKGVPKQTREMMNEKVYHSEIKVNDSYKKLLKATNIQRFLIRDDSGFIEYGNNLAAKRDISIFQGPRILMNRILSDATIDAAYIEIDDIINNSDVFNILPKNPDVNIKSLLALISSKLCSHFFRSNNINLNRKAYPKLNVGTLEQFPIPDLFFLNEDFFSSLIDNVTNARLSLHLLRQKFLTFLSSKFRITKLSRKLQNWHELEFGEFIKELNKSIKASNKVREKEGLAAVPELTKKDEFEWMELFEENKKKAVALQQQITATDNEIDRLVYELYGLTEEEIKIVENA
ncbi:TaqI restriction endonuclease [Gillisia sp. Hel_I_86]|uniref:Eco57I restriction-modification methylase domain-containing protein n=1 Tax=Gillisia sp. Hel_I_86 TaxID=1249981 RepID=UPI00119BC945|nr:N-6 DNA methylase [Gillisia sp. Hel_I_86]TVZ27635.1 TaqI restriction endonuclease [Gillisia sp. Hel_I_86]